MKRNNYDYYNRKWLHAVQLAEAEVWRLFPNATSDVEITARNNALERASHAGDIWAEKRDACVSGETK